MGSPSAPKSETVYKPGKETIYQTYTPMYIQKALADSSEVAQRNLQTARSYYADVAQGLGITIPDAPEFESYDATKFLPGKEEIAKGEQVIKQEQKKQKQNKKDKPTDQELYNAAVMTTKFGKPGVNSKIFS